MDKKKVYLTDLELITLKHGLITAISTIKNTLYSREDPVDNEYMIKIGLDYIDNANILVKKIEDYL